MAAPLTDRISHAAREAARRRAQNKAAEMAKRLIPSLPPDAEDYAWDDEHYNALDAIVATLDNERSIMPDRKARSLFDAIRNELKDETLHQYLQFDSSQNGEMMFRVQAGILIGIALERARRQRNTLNVVRLVTRDDQRAEVNQHEGGGA